MTTALFLLDAVMNALMLALAVRLGGGRIFPVRVLLSAFAGAVIAQTAKELSRAQSAALWLPAAMVMMRIAVGKAARRRLVADALVLLCAAGFAGGLVLAMWGATGSLPLAYALGGCAAVFVGMRAARARNAGQAVTHARVICTYRGKQAALEAMIDSGNTLRDYLTHLPVIVIPEQTGRSVLNTQDKPLRPIFAQTAGGRQRMYVLVPEWIALEMNGIRREVQAVIALSPQMSADVPALVPAALSGSLWNSNRGG